MQMALFPEDESKPERLAYARHYTYPVFYSHTQHFCPCGKWIPLFGSWSFRGVAYCGQECAKKANRQWVETRNPDDVQRIMDLRFRQLTQT